MWPKLGHLDDPLGDSCLIGFASAAVVIAPLSTLTSLHPRLRSPLRVLSGAALLLLLEATGVATGTVEYNGWSSWFSAIRCLVVAGLPHLYAGWVLHKPILIRGWL